MRIIIFFLLLLSLSAFGQTDTVYHKSYLATPVYRPGDFIPSSTKNHLIDLEIPANKAYVMTEVDLSPVIIQAIQPVTQSGIVINSDYIGSTDTNDFVSYSVPLLGKTKVSLSYSRQWDTPTQGQAEVRAGSLTGPVIGTIITPNTGAWGTYSTIATTLLPSAATTVFIVFKTTGVGNIKTITFEP